MLFPLNQFPGFLIAMPNFSLDILYTIDLKVFHPSSAVPAGISGSLTFTEACRSSITLLIFIMLVARFLIGIWFFLILRPILSLVVDLVMTWSVLQMAPLITLLFRKSGRLRYHMRMLLIRCQCLSLWFIQELLWIYLYLNRYW